MCFPPYNLLFHYAMKAYNTLYSTRDINISYLQRLLVLKLCDDSFFFKKERNHVLIYLDFFAIYRLLLRLY